MAIFLAALSRDTASIGRPMVSGVQLSMSRTDGFLRNNPFECKFKLSWANFSMLHSFMICGGSLPGTNFGALGRLAYSWENCWWMWFCFCCCCFCCVFWYCWCCCFNICCCCCCCSCCCCFCNWCGCLSCSSFRWKLEQSEDYWTNVSKESATLPMSNRKIILPDSLFATSCWLLCAWLICCAGVCAGCDWYLNECCFGLCWSSISSFPGGYFDGGCCWRYLSGFFAGL